MSPGWQSRYRQMASSVCQPDRLGFACLEDRQVLRVMPMASARSLDFTLRRASMTSRLMRIAWCPCFMGLMATGRERAPLRKGPSCPIFVLKENVYPPNTAMAVPRAAFLPNLSFMGKIPSTLNGKILLRLHLSRLIHDPGDYGQNAAGEQRREIPATPVRRKEGVLRPGDGGSGPG